MDAYAAKRIAAILVDRKDAVVEHWTRNVRESLRGRMTRAELGRQLEELFGALLTALDAAERLARRPRRRRAARACSPSSPAAGPGRASTPPRPRSACSRSRTAVMESHGRDRDAADDGRLRSRSRPSSTSSGCFTFETYVNARDAIIAEQSAAAARTLHSGGQAVGRRRGRAADRHARLGPVAGRHGAAAAGAGRHRLAVRHPRHHRRARGRHPGRPAHPQDRGRRPADGRAVHHLRHPAADRPDDRVARHRVRRHRDQGQPGRRAAVRAAGERRRAGASPGPTLV